MPPNKLRTSPARFAACLALYAAAAIALGACLGSDGKTCADGTVCPGDLLCAPSQGCTEPGRLSACDGLPDGQACSFLETKGLCDAGVCVSFVCGDGRVDGGEDCEAGVLGEARCESFGFHGGQLACSASCRFDTSACLGRCGDRALNAPFETCEGQVPVDLDCSDRGFGSGTLGCSATCELDTSNCREAFQPVVARPLPSAFYSSVWGRAPDDIYAVANGEVLLHYDGLVWLRVSDLPVSAGIVSVWGTDDGDLYVVGEAGLMLHHDGQRWQRVATETEHTLVKVWARDSRAVFAIGEGGTLLEYDGERAKVTTIDDSRPMRDLWGSDSNNVFVVGDDGLVLRYDGAGWSSIPAPEGLDESSLRLASVGGSDASSVFATGDYQGNPVALHYDGNAWTFEVLGEFGSLRRVWSNAYEDTYALLDAGLSIGTVMRFDGHRWIDAGLELPAGALSQLWGSGPGHMMFFSLEGDISRVESPWTKLPPAVLRAASTWGAPEDLFAVGGTERDGDIAHYDGSRWTLTPTGVKIPFHDVWGSGPDNVVAVSSAASQIAHYNGSTWVVFESPNAHTRVWGSGPSDVYAVTTAGGLDHFDGVSWSSVPTPGLESARAVWGASAAEIFAVGDRGSIRYYDGTTWAAMPSPTGKDLRDIWGTGKNDVFAVGSGGTVLHYDGHAWAVAEISRSDLRRVTGTGPTDVVALGDSVYRFDGLAWTKEVELANVTALGRGPDAMVAFSDGSGGGLSYSSPVCSQSELSCDDGADDDCDQLFDCADPDCAAVATCDDKALDIACGDSIAGNTSPGASRFDLYACSEWLNVGPEAIYTFTAAKSGPVSIALTGLSDDLDLIVTRRAPGAGCNPRNPACLGSSSTDGDEGVAFEAIAGESYCVIVDGYGGAWGSFDALSVSCEE